MERKRKSSAFKLGGKILGTARKVSKSDFYKYKGPSRKRGNSTSLGGLNMAMNQIKKYF